MAWILVRLILRPRLMLVVARWRLFGRSWVWGPMRLGLGRLRLLGLGLLLLWR